MANANKAATSSESQQVAARGDQDTDQALTTSNIAQSAVSSSAGLAARTSRGTPTTTVRAAFAGSRNSSPARRNNVTEPPNSVQTARARSAALSPTRTAPASPGASTPSAAAVQRALSVASPDNPKLLPRAEGQTKLTRSQTDLPKVASPKLGPARVKSPPPSSASSSRRSSTSSTVQPDSSVTSPALTPSSKPQDVPEKTLSPTQAQQRPPRGPSGLGSRLETVKESSISPQNRSKLPENFNQETMTPTPASKGATPSDEKPPKSAQIDQKAAPSDRSATPQPQAPSRKPSTSSLVPHKTRANAEGSTRMTVETETVQSIPQNAASISTDRTGSARVGTGGTLRTRPSTDTIRPKKEKKKSHKRPPPIVPGPGSSKAELFEQRVNSEIEGESTDSDETFVYESNPAEAPSRIRHHSRTPSTASLSGPPDRSRGGSRIATGGDYGYDRPMRPKRSMKFASSSYAGSSVDDESTDVNQGTVRMHHNMRSTPRPDGSHKHVSRIHRDGGRASDSPLESDSPFSQAQRVRTAAGTGWRSPKGSGGHRADGSNQVRTPTKTHFDSLAIDTNASGASDDERMPLLRTLRNPRTRGPHRLRHADIYEPHESRGGCLSRMMTLVLVAVFCLLMLGVGGAGLFATSKPLYDVAVMEIQNVLASEQEIMLDLLVQAVNPNVASINVNEMDINVFAKSRHVGDPDHDDDGNNNTEVSNLARTRQPRSRTHSYPHTIAYSTSFHVGRNGNVDDGTDPIPCPPDEPSCPLPDNDHDRQTMLLGRIFHFDSALSFEPSPLRRNPANSSGELRLAHPGNRTESGGTVRWERVLKHPFELIVRGILEYQLPLSTKVQTKSVGASVAVFPEEDVGGGSMRTVMLSRLESAERGGKLVRMGDATKEDGDKRVSIPEGDDEVSIPEKDGMQT